MIGQAATELFLSTLYHRILKDEEAKEKGYFGQQIAGVVALGSELTEALSEINVEQTQGSGFVSY